MTVLEELISLGRQFGRDLTDKAYKAACLLWCGLEDPARGKGKFYDAAAEGRKEKEAEEAQARKAQKEAEAQAAQYKVAEEPVKKAEKDEDEVPEWKRKKKARKKT
jgi:hypothetical protein